jgi:glycosyltransferase involved in cell wall biosynthesis/tetratricopeptide (TPR) repeat protein
MDLSVVIATWNEAANLPPLITELRKALAPHALAYEILVVDGGSRDGTAEVARGLGCEVMLQEEEGFGGAIRTGLDRARGAWILTMDADLSHPPDFFGEMWRRREEAEVVIASRFVPGGRADMPRLRIVLSRILNRTFSELLAIPLRDLSSGFRLYRASAVRAFRTEARDFNVQQELLTGLLVRGGRALEVPFHYRPRVHGSSHARIWKFGRSYLRSLWHLFFVRATAFAGGRARRLAPYALVIVLATVAAYAGSLKNGFVHWDDADIALESRTVDGLGPAEIARIFDPRAPRAEHGAPYAPLSDLSYAVDRRLFGTTDARPFHIQGILFHAAAAVLLFALVNRHARSAGIALGAALIFALHPAATDAVTWIAGRGTPIAAAFVLGAALAWERWREEGGRGAYAASLGLGLLADLTRPAAVALPLVLAALDLTRDTAGARGGGGRRSALAYAPHVALAAAFAALPFLVGGRDAALPSGSLTVADRVEVSLIALARYAGLVVAPIGLRPHYGLVYTDVERYGQAAAGAAVAVGLAAGFVALRRRAPRAALAIGGAAATLLPALGAFGPQGVAERYMYLPLAFASVGVAAGLAAAVRVGPPPAELGLERALVRRRRAGAAALAAALLMLGAATHVRNRAWRDDLALWSDAVAKDPFDFVARGLHGSALLKAGAYEEAERELRSAAAVAARLPQRAGASPVPALLAGVSALCERRGDAGAAEQALLAAVRAEPGSGEAAVRLADFYARRGDLARARAVYRYAVETCRDADLARERLRALPATP